MCPRPKGIISSDPRRYTAINYLRESKEGRAWLRGRSVKLTPDQTIIFKMHELKSMREAKDALKNW